MSLDMIVTVTTLARRHRTGPGALWRPRRCSCGERLTSGVCSAFVSALVAAFLAAGVPSRHHGQAS